MYDVLPPVNRFTSGIAAVLEPYRVEFAAESTVGRSLADDRYGVAGCRCRATQRGPDHGRRPRVFRSRVSRR